MRFIGLDVHRDFCEVAIVEDGQVRSAGRVASSEEMLEVFGTMQRTIAFSGGLRPQQPVQRASLHNHPASGQAGSLEQLPQPFHSDQKHHIQNLALTWLNLLFSEKPTFI